MSHDNPPPSSPSGSQTGGALGRLAGAASRSRLTPLLALFGLLLGVFAAWVTPREEEPQIDVTMANVLLAFPGASVDDVTALLTHPMEQVLSEIEGIEHLYSVSQPGQAVITVEFAVGIPRNEALVRLYNAVYSNQDWRPPGLALPPPLIKPKSIDDVPILSLTLWSPEGRYGAFELGQVAHALESELQRVPGTRDIYTLGAPQDVVRVRLDSARLAAHNLSPGELRQALLASNQVLHAGATVADNAWIPVQAGTFLTRADELAHLVVGVHEGRPVFLSAVAEIQRGPADNTRYVTHWPGAGAAAAPGPAVTLAISKKPGENAVEIASALLERLTLLQATHVPEAVEIRVTRNYGATADDKARKLIQKLLFATLSVVVLVLVALGRREAVVVGVAVILTLALTLFASWAWGFTLNRVSLFALIFSIGILVDDAIVVVENIHRHRALGASLQDAIVRGVDEVGGPTVLATFTVMAALLPMAFVSGLMGPYMSPIPINASMGMLLSLIVALTVTPWLSARLLRVVAHASPVEAAAPSRLSRLFERVLTPFLGVQRRRNRYLLGLGMIGLILLAVWLVPLQAVVLKMLPFDNKSEFQVVVDLPEGTALERTQAALVDMADVLRAVPEVEHMQLYAGTSAPISFNGLVRQYDLREAPHLGDIQVNLQDKSVRARSSHAIAQAVRPALQAVATRYGAVVRVVEVPPGPPVLAPVVAEIYGPDAQGRAQRAQALLARFRETQGLVDTDVTLDADSPRQVVVVDRAKAALLGVSQADVVATLAAGLGGDDVSYLQTGHARYPVPIRLQLGDADRADLARVLDLPVRSRQGAQVPLAELVEVREARWEQTRYHKDLLPVVYVTGDMAGALDSPLYGLFAVAGSLPEDWVQHYIAQPAHPYDYSLKWDGEWQITYETFRDMGLAYSVGLLLIYLLVVAQFGSYAVPLVIMAPIPLTLVGILPGHALMGAQFTATSMIGMIALAGIIVRNSILLVDFIRGEVASGVALEQAVVQSAAVRAKPIVLTGLAAMLGAFFILDDPIFNGLAVSLIFGILISTLLTLVVIPVLYYALLRRQGG